uniref:Uncharacterized protein n=1 Tax=Arundo donax TaxID=35708 RepID=A0A0A8Z4N4_ARUDO
MRLPTNSTISLIQSPPLHFEATETNQKSCQNTRDST